MSDEENRIKSVEDTSKCGKIRWLGPFGLVATSLAGLAVLAFRGCWHPRMSWPVCMQGHSYQVCLECGVKRLFDEEHFCSYGPSRYDLAELIAWKRTHPPHSHSLPRLASSRNDVIGSEIVAPRIIPPRILEASIEEQILSS
jgi:hypothetical protein